MKNGVHTGAIRRIASTRMPTRWGMFQTMAFERDTPDGAGSVETALAMIMGDVTGGAPLLRHPFAVLHRRSARLASLRLQRSAGNRHAGPLPRRHAGW